MNYSSALANILLQQGINNQSIVYMTIKNVYLQQMRDGVKHVEYRDDTDYYLKKFFNLTAKGKIESTKAITHLLLQGGYNPDSPRVLIELKGIVLYDKPYPATLNISHLEVDEDLVNLVLGEIVYDSTNELPLIATDDSKQKVAAVQIENMEEQEPNYIKPINLVNVSYAQTGQSKTTNELGMREMQEKAYEARSAQYLLLKAPPASGKSRALMFIALDKLINQGVKKVIVAVPERSIGNSFAPNELKKYGFYANWELIQKYNLCVAGSDKSKVKTFIEFLSSDAKILICTHATLRFAFESLTETDFDNCLVAIDEFHHVSADGDNILGNVMRNIMQKSTAHIVAMTGSYFRGDSVPVLLPEDEEKFIKVTYNYYNQLNGYEYLKSLGIGYHFYQGRYYKVQPEKKMSALEEILDENLKTIIHIPSVNSAESSGDKLEEVNHIIDCIGELEYQDTETGVLFVKSKRTGRILKIADLVNDNQKERDKIVAFLRGVKTPEDIDMIIALGMAKEGFDWPFCQHALTIGYRGSLTEIIQIIGRATRDSHNKVHAQFTNLIAQPDAVDDDVKLAVNNMLKAITASLLMEQVLAPNFKFKPMEDDDEDNDENTIKIRGFKKPTSQRAKDIIESDLNDLKARILQNDTMLKALPGNLEPEVINKVLIPKIIREIYPDLSADDVEAVRQYIVVDSVIKNGEVEEHGSKKFIRMAGSFVNIDDIHIDLIDTVNPFQKAFEILSKNVTTKVLKSIQDTINITKIEMTEEEAVASWEGIKRWNTNTGKAPDINSYDPKEQRLAQALLFLQDAKRRKNQNG